MNFTIDKDLFLDALINVSKVTSTKSPIRVLEGIKFAIKNNSIEITGYNLEMGMRT
jgi:DNA polymerase-3 subunit beta